MFCGLLFNIANSVILLRLSNFTVMYVLFCVFCFSVLFCVLFVCKCTLYDCPTQLQLSNYVYINPGCYTDYNPSSHTHAAPAVFNTTEQLTWTVMFNGVFILWHISRHKRMVLNYTCQCTRITDYCHSGYPKEMYLHHKINTYCLLICNTVLFRR
jgi:hypothetical protein